MNKLFLILSIFLFLTACGTTTKSVDYVTVQNKQLKLESISKGVIEAVKKIDDAYIYTIKLRKNDEFIDIFQATNSLYVGDSVIILHNENKTKIIKNTSE